MPEMESLLNALFEDLLSNDIEAIRNYIDQETTTQDIAFLIA